MEKEIIREARKAYFKNFRGFFVIVIILFVIFAALAGKNMMNPKQDGRNNSQAPDKRVFDEAGTLTTAEINELNAYIAEAEKNSKADIVLLITNQEMGISDYEWTHGMMNCADDFYDNRAFGYDKPYGDGSLLLYNWYEDENGSQKGVWLSTSGKMERTIGSYEEDDVLDALERYLLNGDPVKGYKAAIDRLEYWGAKAEKPFQIPWVFGVLSATLVAFVYATANMKAPRAMVTTTATSFVHDHTPIMNSQTDNFIRKSIAKAVIVSESGGSGHSGGGSYGSHTSSGGHSHGGGGRRH